MSLDVPYVPDVPYAILCCLHKQSTRKLHRTHLPNLATCMLPWGLNAAAIRGHPAARRASHSCGHVPDRLLQKPVPVGREGALGAQAHPVAEQHPTDGQVRHFAA